jgi:predicted helicase
LKYKWKRRPYKHQVAAVKTAIAELGRSGGFALLMEPRTGKTKTAIDIAAILHGMGNVNRVLIVCPVIAIDVWVQELKANCPYPVRAERPHPCLDGAKTSSTLSSSTTMPLPPPGSSEVKPLLVATEFEMLSELGNLS